MIFNLQLLSHGREITINPNGKISLGGEKEKETINSMERLMDVFDELVSNVLKIINKNRENFLKSADMPIYIPRYEIQPEYKKLLVEQLMMDVLFDKYFSDSPEMTLKQYCEIYRNYRWDDESDDDIADSVRKYMREGIDRMAKNMDTDKIREQIEKLGRDPDEYLKNFTNLSTFFQKGKTPEKVRHHKPYWDNIYYNSEPGLITRKQYDRSFSKNGNYSHKAIVEMFDNYDKFVKYYFGQVPNNSKDYFTASFDLYNLELCKRIDFIYKLAERLEGTETRIHCKDHPLVKRFISTVVTGFDYKDDEYIYDTILEPCRPMLMLEDLWQQQKKI